MIDPLDPAVANSRPLRNRLAGTSSGAVAATINESGKRDGLLGAGLPPVDRLWHSMFDARDHNVRSGAVPQGTQRGEDAIDRVRLA